jgi:hypothetical protein
LGLKEDDVIPQGRDDGRKPLVLGPELHLQVQIVNALSRTHLNRLIQGQLSPGNPGEDDTEPVHLIEGGEEGAVSAAPLPETEAGLEGERAGGARQTGDARGVGTSPHQEAEAQSQGKESGEGVTLMSPHGPASFAEVEGGPGVPVFSMRILPARSPAPSGRESTTRWGKTTAQTGKNHVIGMI